MQSWEPGALISERYTLVGPRDDHGLGEAWRATDRHFGDRRVTVKSLRRVEKLVRLPRALQRNLRAARGFRHPHALSIIDEGVFAERGFVVYEHTDAPSLGSLLDASPEAPRDLAFMRRTFERSAAAVMAGHAEKTPFVHGLVCPATVLIFEGPAGPAPWVIDGGLFGEVDFHRPEPGRARTALCLAPEQHAAEAPTVLTDVFALGLLLLEMLADRGSTRDGIAGYRRRPEVPDALWSVLLRVTRSSPSARLSSVEKLLAVLAPCWDAPRSMRPPAPAAGAPASAPDLSRIAPAPAALPQALELPPLDAMGRDNRESLTLPLKAEHIAAVLEALPDTPTGSIATLGDPLNDPEPTLLDALQSAELQHTLNEDEMALLTRSVERESEMTIDLSSTFQLNADVEALARAASAWHARTAAEEAATPPSAPEPTPPTPGTRTQRLDAAPTRVEPDAAAIPPWAWVSAGAMLALAVALAVWIRLR